MCITSVSYVWDVNSSSPWEGVAEGPLTAPPRPSKASSSFFSASRETRLADPKNAGRVPGVSPSMYPPLLPPPTCQVATGASPPCCPSAVPESAAAQAPPRTGHPAAQEALEFPFLCHFARRPRQVLASALPSQQGWGPAGAKGRESSEILRQAAPRHPGCPPGGARIAGEQLLRNACVGSDKVSRADRGCVGAVRGSGLCHSHSGTQPRLARVLVLRPGLALPLAGWESGQISSLLWAQLQLWHAAQPGQRE